MKRGRFGSWGGNARIGWRPDKAYEPMPVKFTIKLYGLLKKCADPDLIGRIQQFGFISSGTKRPFWFAHKHHKQGR